MYRTAELRSRDLWDSKSQHQNLLREVMRKPVIGLHILKIYILADKTERAHRAARLLADVQQNKRGPAEKGRERQGFRHGEEATVPGIPETPPLSPPGTPGNPGAKGLLPVLTFLMLDLEAG